jgi:hypothetical protein
MTHREMMLPDGQLPVAVMCPKFRVPNHSKPRRVEVVATTAACCRRMPSYPPQPIVDAVARVLERETLNLHRPAPFNERVT